MKAPFVLLATLLVICCSVRAQDAPAPQAGPGWLEKGGAIDAWFGDRLDEVGYVPFKWLDEVLGNAPPPYPWTAANGRAIDADVHARVKRDYGKIVAGRLPDEFPRPWKDQAGNEVPISPQGGAVVTSLPLVVVWLIVAAVFFTLTMRFVNVRMFGHAIQVVRGKYDNPTDHGEVTHFQALSSALSATVGLGNIAGVAIAIMVGGPGATVWMVCAGLLGMTLKFTECTLGQRYRDIDEEGRVLGGPMRYLSKGLRERGPVLGALGAVLSVLFAVFCIGGSLAGGNSFQVNQALTIVKQDSEFFAENGWVFGAVMSVFVGIVIIGGIRRIAVTASRIVPLMCVVYVFAAILVLLFHATEIPAAFGAMLSGAFSADAVYGGMLGALITGFQRAAFSNEAGVGSAAIAHSAARTEFPVREGIVALLEPFIDTVCVCTMTALVIVITGVYNAPEHAELIAGKEGAALTRAAFSSVTFLGMNTWFPYVLLVAVVLFAFSTMISWSYYGERCWCRLFGQRSSIVYKLVFLVFVVLGSIVSAVNVLEFGDLMILIMAFPNIIGLYFLGGHVKRELQEYEQKLRAGEFQAYK